MGCMELGFLMGGVGACEYGTRGLGFWGPLSLGSRASCTKLFGLLLGD